MFRELLERALAAIKGRLTRQRRRQAERQARKEAGRKVSAPNPWGPRDARRRATKPAARGAKHTRTGPQLAPGPIDDPLFAVWHTTQTPPWTKKARARRRNKIAAASRRRNRVTR